MATISPFNHPVSMSSSTTIAGHHSSNRPQNTAPSVVSETRNASSTSDHVATLPMQFEPTTMHIVEAKLATLEAKEKELDGDAEIIAKQSEALRKGSERLLIERDQIRKQEENWQKMIDEVKDQKDKLEKREGELQSNHKKLLELHDTIFEPQRLRSTPNDPSQSGCGYSKIEVCKVFDKRQSKVVDDKDNKQHLKAPSNKLKHQCHVCFKCFAKSGNLKTHLMIHTGEKAFECKLCDATFRRKQRLQQHIRTHTGEKPFTCHACGKCFGNKSNMRRHRKYCTK